MVPSLAIGLILLSPPENEGPSKSRFLADIHVVSVSPSRGEVRFVDRDGKTRTLHEGDALPEEDGARLDDVTSATLVFRRAVTGGNGETGQALIVVRFDASGKTKVREYRDVGSTPRPAPPPPDLN